MIQTEILLLRRSILPVSSLGSHSLYMQDAKNYGWDTPDNPQHDWYAIQMGEKFSFVYERVLLSFCLLDIVCFGSGSTALYVECS